MRAWSQAWHDALYGPSGFFVRQAPLDHFRTNAAVPLFAVAVRRLADLVDRALGFPDPFDVVDVGAGRGELLCALPDVPSRWRLTAVEVSVGPPPLTWATSIPPLTGLLVANEWLDSVPLNVVEDGRLVLVSPDGRESPGAPLASEWADRWWPDRDPTRPLQASGGWTSADPGRQRTPHRVELGAPRDAAWAAAVAQVQRGLAVAIDYGHTAADRRPTLTGYRDGRQVLPVPDGGCDLTAHVALDAVAAASGAVLTTQREALLALGVSSALPDVSGPHVVRATPGSDNSERKSAGSSYAADLARASQARELLDPDGLGGFGWLLNPVGVDLGWISQVKRRD